MAAVLDSAEDHVVQMVCEGLTAQVLRDKLKLPRKLADAIVGVITLDRELVLRCVRDPAQVPQALADWTQTDECDRALSWMSAAALRCLPAPPPPPLALLCYSRFRFSVLVRRDRGCCCAFLCTGS